MIWAPIPQYPKHSSNKKLSNPVLKIIDIDPPKPIYNTSNPMTMYSNYIFKNSCGLTT